MKRIVMWSYVVIMVLYWLSLLWRFHGSGASAAYLFGWAIVWPVAFLQWVF